MIKQTTAQTLGRAGERWFRGLLPSEWIFQRPEEDIGLDGKVIIGTSTSTGDLEFGVQIKTKRRWLVKHNALSVTGLRRDTVKYWGSRVFPTMIVLYDETAGRGYFGWLFDVLLNPHRLLSSPHDTITLKLPAANRLSVESWPRIREDVETHYSNLVGALFRIRLETNTLPTIHSLATALHLLLNAQFVQPQDEHGRKLLAVGELAAHKEVLLSLARLVSTHRIDVDAPKAIKIFLDTYRRVVATFVGNFDEFMAEKAVPIVVQTNPDRQESVRPRLIRMLSELLVELTDTRRFQDEARGPEA